MGRRDAWSGIAQVYLDGALQGTIDTYSAGQQAQAVVYSLSGLGKASHNLTIVAAGTHNANSGGAWVWVDAFDVSTASTTTTAAPPVAALPGRAVRQGGSPRVIVSR
jgi:hypothetical protein